MPYNGGLAAAVRVLPVVSFAVVLLSQTR